MSVAGCLVNPYTLPLTRPYRWAKGAQRFRTGLWIQWVLEDGTRGYGEMAPPPHEPVRRDDLARLARPVLDAVQLAAEGVEADLDRLQAPPRLRHAILGAWLDAHARRARTPLARAVGLRYGLEQVPAASVPVNALITAEPPARCAAAAQAAVAAGFRTLKLKSEGDRGADMARVVAIRKAVGDGPRLRLDANGSWSPTWALDHLKDLRRHGIEYVEQPLAHPSPQAHRHLVRKSPVDIALDESVDSVAAVHRIAEDKSAHVLILKPQRLGGPDRVAAAIRVAQEAGLDCVVTNSLETAIGRGHALHLAALLPTPARDCGLATEGYLALDVGGAWPRPERGQIALPAAPGLGFTPRLEAQRAA